MTKASFIIAFIFSSAWTFAQTANRHTIIIKTHIYCDHCKKCESCSGRMEREFPFIKGVTNYKYDESTSSIIVTYNTKTTTPENIKQAIAKVGFDADELQADPKAVTKFDDCCKKTN